MEDKVSRRQFLKRTGKICLSAILLCTAGYGYMKKIEPQWIENTRVEISHPLIPQSFNGFKIVQFSDTHLGFQFDYQLLQQVINKIMAEKPDLIIFSGDLVDNLLHFNEINEVAAILKTLEAPYGKYAVYGNHDHGGWGTEKYSQIMEAAGFKLLINEADVIRKDNGSHFNILGIDDAMLGKPDIEKAIQGVSDNTFKLLISHAPDTADAASRFPIHFQISGHSHGGQVQIPFYGALITPPYGQKYVEGLYKVSDTFSVYVNRGLGTTRLPYRFLSRPEITIYTLRKKG